MNSQGTSFIPQRPTQGKIKNRGVRKIYILAYVSYILFFATVLAAAGVFFYKLALNTTLDAQKSALAEEKEKFNQGSDMASVKDLDDRIKIATERLNSHISVHSIFDALEKSAVQSLKFDSFSYKRAREGAPTVTLVGSTNKFNSLVFQREVLQSNPVFAGADFMEVGLSSYETNDVTNDSGDNRDTQQVIVFSLSKEIPVTLIGYQARTLDELQQTDSEPVQEEVITEAVISETDVVTDEILDEVISEDIQ